MAKKKGMTHHQGKGGEQQQVSRHERDSITGADPISRAQNNYSKKSPYKETARELERMGLLNMPTRSS